MFRVCYIIDSPYASGAERYISLILGSLDRERFEPSLVVKEGDGLDDWCRRAADMGIPVFRVPLDLPFRPQHAVPVYAALRRIAPHLVHINMPGPYGGGMAVTAPLARMAGAPAVAVTEHLPMVERLWKRALVKGLSYPCVDRVLTVCRDNVRYLIERQNVPEHKIRVVYNGIDRGFGRRRGSVRAAARAEMGLDDADVAMAMVGDLVERKGLSVLLDALGGLDGSWRLFVVGTGEKERSYRETAKRLGFEKRVVFMGERPIDDVERTLCAADMLVLPSFMEGMPYVILEAMACSLPVVASGVNGIPEAVIDGDTGVLAAPGDVTGLRTALYRLASDSGLREKMGRRGRERFEQRFTLERHITDVESIYSDMLGS